MIDGVVNGFGCYFTISNNKWVSGQFADGKLIERVEEGVGMDTMSMDITSNM